jgi:hypothetical protein
MHDLVRAEAHELVFDARGSREADMPGTDIDEAHDGLEQGGLPGSVGPDDRDDASDRDPDRHASQDVLASVSSEE